MTNGIIPKEKRVSQLAKKNLEDIKALLDGFSLPEHKNLTAMLVNEEDEQGPVKIVDEHGTVVYLMPRDVYDAIMHDD